MFTFVLSLLRWFMAFVRSRNSMGLEILALRHQVSILKRKNARPRLGRWDRVLWVFLRRVWSRWAAVLVIVKPETVVRWHRAGFRLYWRFLSRHREKGRPRISFELRQLFERMAKENPTWGSPRTHRATEIGLGDFRRACDIVLYLAKSLETLSVVHPRSAFAERECDL